MICGDLLDNYRSFLICSEKSEATVSKYIRDTRKLLCFLDIANMQDITKEDMLAYKDMLGRQYKVSSANSMIAAANSFLKYIGRADCQVRPFKVQTEHFRKNEKVLSRNEYKRLLTAAKKKSERLALVMETICSTGIRISELRYITVEAVKAGSTDIHLKGKIRTVLLIPKICRKLIKYAEKRRISKGPIFITKSGNILDRSNVLHEMKSICADAGVDRSKVFPHNLRHLFAVTFYSLEKDLAHLADILGHSNINTTRIYTARSKSEYIRIIQKLDLIT